MLEAYTSVFILFSQKIVEKIIVSVEKYFDTTKKKNGKNECTYFKNAEVN